MLNTLLALAVAFPPAPDPRALIDSAIVAMQRTAQVRSVKAYRLSGTQHEYVFGNAERADGPWFPIYSTFSELRDGASSNFRRTNQNISAAGKGPDATNTFMPDSDLTDFSGHMMPSDTEREQLAEWIACGAP